MLSPFFGSYPRRRQLQMSHSKFLFLNSSCLCGGCGCTFAALVRVMKFDSLFSCCLSSILVFFFTFFWGGGSMTRYFTVCENYHGNTKRRIHFLWWIVQSLWLTNRAIHSFVRLSEDHLKLGIVVSQWPTPSVLWASPGTSDPAMLWRGIRYSNSESGDLIHQHATISHVGYKEYFRYCEKSVPKIAFLTRHGAWGSVRDREQPCIS